MHSINKEIELRSEINPSQLNTLEKKILLNHSLKSMENRLSVLFLGMIDKTNFDIRVRINSNKQSEVVLKKGDFHAHDRLEFSQPIQFSQFIGFVRMFSSFGFASKVMKRKTRRFFSDKEKNEIALVEAGGMAYLEIEKLISESDGNTVAKEQPKLEKIINQLGLKSIDKEEFDDLCDRLTKQEDWEFFGTTEHIQRLQRELEDFK